MLWNFYNYKKKEMKINGKKTFVTQSTALKKYNINEIKKYELKLIIMK